MSAIRPELYPEKQFERQETVGSIRVDLFALGVNGLNESLKHGGMDRETHKQFRARWSRLGKEASGPQPPGMNGAGESGQK